MDFDRMLAYCAALEAHNDRNWFHENHKWYEGAKADFTELVELLKFRLAETLPPAQAEELLFARAKDMIYRVPRDMRVYKNRPPYNPSFRAYFSPDKRAILPVSYYLHVQPGDRSMFGTGIWTGGDRALLFQVREYISAHCAQFEDALAQSGCRLWDGPEQKLKNVPRGFDPADRAAEWLKYKEWFASVPLRDAELTDFEAVGERLADLARRMEAFRAFGADALGGDRRDPWDPGDWE